MGHHLIKQIIWSLFFLSLVVPVHLALAQVSFDNTLGQTDLLTGPDYLINADQGRQTGSNLFHSFHQFSLDTGESAVFSGPETVANIISRVTGPDSSIINGRIVSSIPGADFFLINPMGLVFGPGASLEISGSFYASTADYLGFEDQQIFAASPDHGVVLTSATPEAFGFLFDTPAPISVRGHLQGSQAETLSLVGGDMDIEGTIEINQGGTLCLSSLDSGGETNLTGTLTNDFESLGTITLESGSTIASSGQNQAAIYIRAGNFFMEDATVGMYHTGEEDDQSVDILVTDTFQMTDGSAVLTINDSETRGGSIHVDTRELELLQGSQIGTITRSHGRAGDLQVSADTSITISGKDENNIKSGFFSQTTSSGSNGRILIDTPRLEMSDSGQIYSARNRDAGPAQEIMLTTDHLSLDSDAIIVGGDMEIETATMEIRNGALVWGRASGFSDTYTVRINASDFIHITGQQEDLEQWRNTTHPLYTGIHTDVFSGMDGNAGNIDIVSPSITIENSGQIGARSYTDDNGGEIYLHTGTLRLNSGGQIGADSFGSTIYNGSAGNIFVNATESIWISGEIGQLPSGLFSRTRSKGSSGLIQVSSPLVHIDDSGRIAVNTGLLSYGNAGTIHIDTGRLEIFDNGAISSAAGGTGTQGQITVTAGEEIYLRSGIISSLCSYQGTAGDILLQSPLIRLSGGLISSETRNHNSGGNITIFAGDINLTNNSLVTSSSLDTGDAGDINMSADDAFRIDDSAVMTSTVGADGGDIFLGPVSVLHMVNSDITTSVTDEVGNGGNITIEPMFIILDTSRVEANAHEGSGGNINIRAGYFFPDDVSVIQASSALGIDGIVTIETPHIDLESGFAALPVYRTIPELASDSCETRTKKDTGSLVRTGRGGLPPGPLDPLWNSTLTLKPVTD